MKVMTCHNPDCDLDGQEQEVQFLPGERVLESGAGHLRKGKIQQVHCRECGEPLSPPASSADDLPA